MKILSAQQIREADAYTISNETIKSIDLMERASQAFVDWFVKKFDNNLSIMVVTGSGNNRGDGLAIARLLSEKSYQIQVYLALPNDKGSADYQLNLDRLPQSIELINEITPCTDIIIDGLFGSGLTRPVSGNLAKLIDSINNIGKNIVSIDIASGLTCDGIGEGNHIIKPTYTISFQLPKLAFLLPENSSYVGNWQTVDIGLDKDFISTQPFEYTYQVEAQIKKLVKKRSKFSHKGNFGHTLLIGGSYGKIGAVTLASKACIRSGVGLVTSLIPSCGYEIIQSSVPEIMCITSGAKYLKKINIEQLASFSSIGIGPGMGVSQGALALLSEIIASYKKPIVLDADALNLLAKNIELLEMLPEGSILTPHIGEFNSLAGVSDNSLDRLKKQRELSIKYKVIVVLKGANTSITNVDGMVWFNSTGNSGMATAGSGDVLTGMISSLLAQGYSSEQAAQIGAFLHGRSGDIAKYHVGEYSLIASNIVERISDAFISII